ncbi:MAG: DNA-3-methyladenine glycosylase 2 [Gemmatimonadaceae bacterium]
MAPDNAALYKAFASHDARFDGVFFVGVTSTGIYCRPVCTARTPKPGNCRFFETVEAAEKASFRPCLRCRPELAPGTAPVDDGHRIANLVASRIQDGMFDGAANLEAVAAKFGWSSRQIRRVVQRELGVSPIELILTRRLLLSKQLLTETTLPITEIALASGFASLRRFNDAFRNRYGMPPTRLRKVANGTSPSPHLVADTFTLQLAYRPPFDWEGMLGFLRARAFTGIECVDGESYSRTIRLGGHSGWVRVRNAPQKNVVLVELTHGLMAVLPALLGRLRNLFDLNARPDMISNQLMADPGIADIVRQNTGMRVPGCVDGFELAVRAILGQQITVKGATTLAGRYASAFGEPIETLHDGLSYLTPTAEYVALMSVEAIASLGIVKSRAIAILALAREFGPGRLALEAGADPEAVMSRLVALPGIGKWTAHYMAMRALRWPDAFPKEDLVIRNRLGGVTAARAEEMSQQWRPWRSYATLHLWQSSPHKPAGRTRIMRKSRVSA